MSDLRLRRELALLGASDGVDGASLRCWSWLEGRAVNIAFTMATGVPVHVVEHRIRTEEPVRLVYGNQEYVGAVAPTVLIDRPDFPKDLGHINFSAERGPANLCLADTGLQPLYDRTGIFGVVQRLRRWLRDARVGALMADGWEPVPLLAEREAMVMFDAAAFQNHIATVPAGGIAFGVARMIGTPDKPTGFILDAPSEAHDMRTVTDEIVRARLDRRANGDSSWALPWVLAWPAEDDVTAMPAFQGWATLRNLKDALANFKVLESALNGIATTVGSDGATRHADKCGLVLVLAVRRPNPLQGSIYGLSDDPESRRVELRAYFLTAWTNADLLQDNVQIHTLSAYPVITPDLLSWTARGPKAPKIRPLGLIGVGALGSALAEHLLRAGADELVVLDQDTVAPHNLARHVGRMGDVGRPKTRVVAELARDLAFAAFAADVHEIPRSTSTLSADDKERLRKVNVLIDATADERVRSWLSRFGEETDGRILRTELRHRGHLGIAYVGGARGNPSQTDLYAELCYKAVEDDDVAAWLAQDASDGTGEESIRLAAGCASATVRMTSSVVAAHAAAFMPTVLEAAVGEHPAGLGLNILDDSYRPRGWRWMDVSPVTVHEANGWRVRISGRVESLMDEESRKAGSVETGGYLWGRIDYGAQEVTVVTATPQPPGTEASATSLRLPQAGRTRLDRRLAERAKGKLQIVGTWHTHPGGRAEPSQKDLATFAEAFAVDQQRGLPSLFLIRGIDGTVAYFVA